VGLEGWLLLWYPAPLLLCKVNAVLLKHMHVKVDTTHGKQYGGEKNILLATAFVCTDSYRMADVDCDVTAWLM